MSGRDSKELSKRQQRFIAEYIVLGDERQAALRAGYASRTAGATAKRILGMPSVAWALESHEVDVVVHDEVTREWVVARLKEVAERCMQSREEKGGQYKFDASNANRALNLLGKYLHMFSERVEHQVSMHESALEELE